MVRGKCINMAYMKMYEGESEQQRLASVPKTLKQKQPYPRASSQPSSHTSNSPANSGKTVIPLVDRKLVFP